MFHAMPPAPPSLWIYSLNDEILDIPSIEKMIAKWRARGDDVQTVLDESPHVKNALTAPDAYYDAVRRRVGDFRSNGGCLSKNIEICSRGGDDAPGLSSL